jgi:hypothetical protein
MKRKALPLLVLIFAMLLPSSANAWNATGHQLVARIAWEQMTDNARRNVLAILTGAPHDACLLDLMPNTGSPEERARTFFVRASTWPDIVRPNDRPGMPDTRECTKFHRRDWHFINFFWTGISGATNANRPRDLTPQELKRIQRPDVNAVMLLNLFEPFMACDKPQCGTSREERAITLAWILHLVGDIHQPLHTSARVTATEPNGDQGGNLCKLAESARFSLHSFWDGIIDLGSPRQQNESDAAYVERMARLIMQEHPRSQMVNRLRPFSFDAWAREGLDATKNSLYPQSLACGPTQTPSAAYLTGAFGFSKQTIALAGYRLAELLNLLFGS